MDKIFDAAMTYSVGFEDLFNRMHSSASIHTSYPPYNIVKETESEWRIEMALAGWSKDDIEISTETNILTIKSKVDRNQMETLSIVELPRGHSLRHLTSQMM